MGAAVDLHDHTSAAAAVDIEKQMAALEDTIASGDDDQGGAETADEEPGPDDMATPNLDRTTSQTPRLGRKQVIIVMAALCVGAFLFRSACVCLLCMLTFHFS